MNHWRERIDWALVAVLASVAVVHLWVLKLPFQVDDFTLIRRPWALFQLAIEDSAVVESHFALRWPLWVLWGLIDAIVPTPRNPLGYHLVGLTMHVITTGLVASVARRLTPGAPRVAGLAAALVFGLSHGAAQAFSWTSAWADVFMALFTLAAMRALMAGRERPNSSTLGLGLWCLLAVVAKTPGLLVPPIMLLWIGLLPGADAARRRREGLAVGIALACGLLARWLYLGTLRPRYSSGDAPGLADGPSMLFDGMARFGQALAPWNRAPIFADLAPASATLLEHLGPLSVAVIIVLCMALVAGLVAPRAWRLWLALGIALAAFVAPSGALPAGDLDNSMGRVAYLPLAVLAVYFGAWVGASARCGRGWRWIAGGLLAASMALHLDLGRHVRSTEQRAANERTQQLTAFSRALASLDGSDTLLLRWPPHEMGGISQVGPMFDAVLEREFGQPRSTSMPRIDSFASDKQLLDACADASLTTGTLVVLDVGDPHAPDRVLAARELHPRWQLGLDWRGRFSERASMQIERGPSATRLRFDAPVPAWGFAGLQLESGPSERLVANWTDVAGRVWTTHIPAGAGRWALEAPRDLDFRLGPGLAGIEIRGAEVHSASLLARLPRAQLSLNRSGAGDAQLDSDVNLHPTRPPGPFDVTLPTGWSWPGTLRLTVAFDSAQGKVEVFADVPVDASIDGTLLLSPRLFHVDSSALPGAISVPRAPWSDFYALLAPADGAQGQRVGAVSWSVALLYPDGSRAAESDPISGTFSTWHSGS